MPVLETSAYKNTNFLLFNGHIQTIYPALFRKIKIKFEAQKLRIDTPDIDFLDLEWYQNGCKKLAILSHGLEGNSQTQYILGMTSYLLQNNYDVLCWNYRSCSGEMNRQKRIYHMGATDDLDFVINFALSKNYELIDLIGFSAGGNITLKYLGEIGHNLSEKINKAVVFSVPLHLSDCTQQLQLPKNKVYEHRFLKSLKKKAILKSAQFPEIINWKKLKDVKHIWEFDEYITAPLHGFLGAEDYYEKSSSIRFIDKITIPTLIVNAENDPFLGEKSYPKELINKLKDVYFEIPKQGGHCGFYSNGNVYWSEKRAVEFLTNTIF